MNRTDAMTWVRRVCANYLRLSQAKTLSVLVVGTLVVEQLSLARLGRCLPGPAGVKHAIKRVWRFANNRGVKVGPAMRGVLEELLKGYRGDLLVSFDWTDIGAYKVLMAAACLKGRAIPLLWTVLPGGDLGLQMGQAEERLLWELRQILPAAVRPVILADRGFAKTWLLRRCRQLGLGYVIRLNAEVFVRARRFTGSLASLPLKPGVRRFWSDVCCRKRAGLVQNVVVYWQRGLPARRNEPWFLATNLEGTPFDLVKLYGRRMEIEEFFRDSKNPRNGLALRHLVVHRADRLERLLLVAAIAYILTCGVGLLATFAHRPAKWASANRAGQCSLWQIGRIMLDRWPYLFREIIDALKSYLLTRSPNWG